MNLCCCTWKSPYSHPDCPEHGRRQFCAECGERLDPDAGGACGECGWIPPTYDDGTPSPAFREDMLDAAMSWRGCDRAEAVAILNRVADRLGGATHEEAVAANPLPEEPTS